MNSGIRPARERRSAVLRAGALLVALLVSWSFGLLGSQVAAAETVAGKSAAKTASGVNFWIISSRGCPLGTKVLDGAGFDYLRYDLDGTPTWGDETQFHASLIPGAPLCVSVHGSFVDWSDVATDGYETARWLRAAAPGRPLNVVLFSWKSRGPFTLSTAPWIFSAFPQIDAELLGRRSAFVGLYLGRLIADLPVGHPVTLFGHSHGCRSVSSALHVLGGGQVQGYVLANRPKHKRRIRAILAAAAIDHHWLNPDQRYGRAIDVAEMVVSLRNHRDTVLQIYALRHPLSNKALANIGFTYQDRVMMGKRSEKVVELDVSAVVGSNHGWPYYYARPEIARSVVDYVHFVPPEAGTSSSAKERAGGSLTR